MGIEECLLYGFKIGHGDLFWRCQETLFKVAFYDLI